MFFNSGGHHYQPSSQQQQQQQQQQSYQQHYLSVQQPPTTTTLTTAIVAGGSSGAGGGQHYHQIHQQQQLQQLFTHHLGGGASAAQQQQTPPQVSVLGGTASTHHQQQQHHSSSHHQIVEIVRENGPQTSVVVGGGGSGVGMTGNRGRVAVTARGRPAISNIVASEEVVNVDDSGPVLPPVQNSLPQSKKGLTAAGAISGGAAAAATRGNRPTGGSSGARSKIPDAGIKTGGQPAPKTMSSLKSKQRSERENVDEDDYGEQHRAEADSDDGYDDERQKKSSLPPHLYREPPPGQPFSEEDRHRLVEEVKVRPYIWDSSHPDHSRKDLRRATFHDIASILTEVSPEQRIFEADDIAKGWRYMRDQYCRAKRQQKLYEEALMRGEDVQPPTITWKFYEHMLFLDGMEPGEMFYQHPTPVAPVRYGHYNTMNQPQYAFYRGDEDGNELEGPEHHQSSYYPASANSRVISLPITRRSGTATKERKSTKKGASGTDDSAANATDSGDGSDSPVQHGKDGNKNQTSGAQKTSSSTPLKIAHATNKKYGITARTSDGSSGPNSDPATALPSTISSGGTPVAKRARQAMLTPGGPPGYKSSKRPNRSPSGAARAAGARITGGESGGSSSTGSGPNAVPLVQQAYNVAPFAHMVSDTYRDLLSMGQLQLARQLKADILATVQPYDDYLRDIVTMDELDEILVVEDGLEGGSSSSGGGPNPVGRPTGGTRVFGSGGPSSLAPIPSTSGAGNKG